MGRGLEGNRNEQGDFVEMPKKKTDLTNMMSIRDELINKGSSESSEDVKFKVDKFINAFRKKNKDGERSVIYKMLELNPNIINHLTPEEVETGTFPSENMTKEFQDDMFGAYNAALSNLTNNTEK